MAGYPRLRRRGRSLAGVGAQVRPSRHRQDQLTLELPTVRSERNSGWHPEEAKALTLYILLGRKKLPPESTPSPEHVYDDDRQLWIDSNSGEPLVSCMRTRAQPTQFGETTLTETREGADRPEGAVQACEFGETILTRTREGVDQAEGSALQASQYGETTMTKTGEGADQIEGATLQECDAAYSHF
jgi:hypothetical protein